MVRRPLGFGLVVLCGYVAAEAVFRVNRHRELKRTPPALRVLDAPILRMDSDIGFRYIPGAVARHLILDGANDVTHANVIRINSSGHVSSREDVIEKPPGEYRIAIVGDSFTACLYNDAPWPLLLEDLLNTDAGLLRSLGRSRFKVMNFGMIATGFAQWPALYEHEVARYRPDLFLVAFIESDLWRGFKWADTIRPDPDAAFQLVLISERPPVTLANPFVLMERMIVLSPQDAADPERRRLLVRAAMDRKLAAMPWWSPNPEILAVLLDSASLPAPDVLLPRLPARPKGRPRWGAEARLRDTGVAMRTLAARQGTIFLHLPTGRDLTSTRELSVLHLPSEARSLETLSLLDSLLQQRSAENPDAWFIPANGHLTQRGAQVYAQATYGVLASCLRGQRSPRCGLAGESGPESAVSR